MEETAGFPVCPDPVGVLCILEFLSPSCQLYSRTTHNAKTPIAIQDLFRAACGYDQDNTGPGVFLRPYIHTTYGEFRSPPVFFTAGNLAAIFGSKDYMVFVVPFCVRHAFRAAHGDLLLVCSLAVASPQGFFDSAAMACPSLTSKTNFDSAFLSEHLSLEMLVNILTAQLTHFMRAPL